MAIDKSSSSFKRNKTNAKSGLKEIRNNLQKALADIEEGAAEGLEEVAQTIHNTSNRYAPMDTGELRDSSYYEQIEAPDKVVYEIGYTADHAVYAHENAGRGVDYVNPTTSGTHWKFLEKAVGETTEDIERVVADAAKNKLRNGG